MHLSLLGVGVHGQYWLVDARVEVAVLRVTDAHTAVDREVLVGEKGRLSLKIVLVVVGGVNVVLITAILVFILLIEKAIRCILLAELWALEYVEAWQLVGSISGRERVSKIELEFLHNFCCLYLLGVGKALNKSGTDFFQIISI